MQASSSSGAETCRDRTNPACAMPSSLSSSVVGAAKAFGKRIAAAASEAVPAAARNERRDTPWDELSTIGTPVCSERDIEAHSKGQRLQNGDVRGAGIGRAQNGFAEVSSLVRDIFGEQAHGVAAVEHTGTDIEGAVGREAQCVWIAIDETEALTDVAIGRVAVRTP